MKKTKMQKGITLMALIITIVVLLIITTVAIRAINDDAIIEYAKHASSEYGKATENELITLGKLEELISSKIDGEKNLEQKLKEYFLGKNEQGIDINTVIESQDEDSIVFKNNIVIDDAESSIIYQSTEIKENIIEIKVKYAGEEYVITVDAQTNITKDLKKISLELVEYDVRKLRGTITQTDGTNLWSSVLTLNVQPDESLNLSLEQKREILANICGFSSFQLLTEYVATTMETTYDAIYPEVGYNTEEAYLNDVILFYRDLIDYKNIEQLQDAGLAVFKVQDPQGNLVYMTNLGGITSCAVSKNGNHIFTLKSGQYTSNNSVTVSTIKNKNIQGPHEVTLELNNEAFNVLEDAPVMYSVDDSDEWFLLNENKVVTCNSSISFKNVEGDFSSTEEGAYQGMQYVELDDDFYKYWLNGYQWYEPNGYNTALGLVLFPVLMAQSGIYEVRNLFASRNITMR